MYSFFSALLSVVLLSACSNLQGTNRIPTSVDDVGVIGPHGESILYFKEGRFIIVRFCDPNTTLGMTPTQARNNCDGKSNRVPVETFKEALRNLVGIDLLKLLKPLSPEEVEAYIKAGPSSDQINAMVNELEKINHFITVYGGENANLVRKEELVKALRSFETRISAFKKINAEVERVVSLIANPTKLTLVKFSSDHDQFIYTALKQFNPNLKFPCGLIGSVDERIKDCSYQSTSEKEGFVLVTRSKDFKEVHKEISTGLLWSDRIPLKMNHYSALKACNADLKEVVGISDVHWRLPSIDEYKQAEINGIRRALPNMNYFFWSSTVPSHMLNSAMLFVGTNGFTDYNLREYVLFFVRCVAR